MSRPRAYPRTPGSSLAFRVHDIELDLDAVCPHRLRPAIPALVSGVDMGVPICLVGMPTADHSGRPASERAGLGVPGRDGGGARSGTSWTGARSRPSSHTLRLDTAWQVLDGSRRLEYKSSNRVEVDDLRRGTARSGRLRPDAVGQKANSPVPVHAGHRAVRQVWRVKGSNLRSSRDRFTESVCLLNAGIVDLCQRSVLGGPSTCPRHAVGTAPMAPRPPGR